MLKLTEYVGIFHFPFVLWAKTWENYDIQNFYREILNFLNFRLFSQKSAIFRSGMFYNYITPWPIVLILVCVDREGTYLPIDYKINFIGGSVWKI